MKVWQHVPVGFVGRWGASKLTHSNVLDVTLLGLMSGAAEVLRGF